MQKEKLTLDRIKTDVHFEIKDSYIRLTVFSAFLLVMIGLFFAIIKSGFVFTVFKLFFGIGAVLFIILLITQITDLLVLYRNLKNKKCIVKDKLISAEIKEDLYGKAYVKTYHLNFSGYGEYVIHAENYKWSTAFSMNAEGVYNYADSGDEFYLVLSKPHTGKILFAYNTKMFEME